MGMWIAVVLVTAVLFGVMGLFVRATGSTGCAGRLLDDSDARCDACPLRQAVGVDRGDFGACPGLPDD